MIKKFSLITTIALSTISLAALILLSPPAPSLAQQGNTCSDITAVFARGSGQGFDEDEFKKFRDGLTLQLLQPGVVKASLYELGSKSQNGYQYPAIKVDDFSTASSAKLTNGFAGEYGKSVTTGIKELYTYVNSRLAKCPNTKFVLAGYSQGAQVIGQSLAGFPRDIRDKILFVAFFGDPKLYLPEGEDTFAKACFGKDYSPWRRGVESCKTYAGALGARNPYLPKDLERRAGLWCNKDDYICGSSEFYWQKGGHEKYKDPGGAIDLAVNEITQRTYRMAQKEGQFSLNGQQVVENGANVYIFLESTTRMAPFLETAKSTVSRLANYASSTGGQFDVSLFRVYTDGLPPGAFWTEDLPLYSPYGGFRSDLSELDQRLATIKIYGEAYRDQKEQLRVLSNNIQGVRWPKNDNPKRIIFLTNAPYNTNKSQATQAIFNESRTRFRLVQTGDPNLPTLSIIAPPGVAETYRDLTSKEAGVEVSSYGTPEQIMNQFESAPRTQLRANLHNTDYKARPGDSLRFDTSNSYVINDNVQSYEWDFTGDGTIDRTTTDPVTEYAYPSDYTGMMSVRINTKSGLSDTTSAAVLISTDPLPKQIKAPTSLQIELLDDNTAKLNWQSGDDNIESWAVFINGIMAGRTPKEKRYATITDIDRSQDFEYSVAAVTPEGAVGERTQPVLLRAKETGKPSSPPSSEPLLPALPNTAAITPLGARSAPFTPGQPLLPQAIFSTPEGLTFPQVIAPQSTATKQTASSLPILFIIVGSSVIGLVVLAGVGLVIKKHRSTIK